MDFEKYKRICGERRNHGVLAEATVSGEYVNQGCGDNYVIYLKVRDGRVEDASFTTTGCNFGFAALSLLMDLIRGKTLEEAERVTAQEIDAALGGFPPRRNVYPQSARAALQGVLEKARAGLRN